MDLNLKQSNDGLLVLEKFHIKYGCLGNGIWNNVPHWSFSKFGMEFELQIREAI
jgi:hypothetical protein